MRTIQNLLCAAAIFMSLPAQITAQVWAKTETNQPKGTATLIIDVVDKNTVWAAHDGGFFTPLDDLKNLPHDGWRCKLDDVYCDHG
jgi:hypothetical protein